jgi:hypothetical protein
MRSYALGAAGTSPISGVGNEICKEEAIVRLKEGIMVLVESRDEEYESDGGDYEV